ncbi:sulfur carrier protein ThiS [Pectinatus cerevisiiphilus]|nr:sulfur carrier protein ThiS [Pectinatus cerevisiiphilus]
MQIFINGKKTQLEEGTSLQSVMEKKAMSGGRAVAELNEQIIAKEVWPKTALKENDMLEIVTFMGGGSK